MSLQLRAIRVDDEQEVLAAHSLMLNSDNFQFALFIDDEPDFASYVERLEHVAKGENIKVGKVASSLLVAVVDGIIVGRTSIRHDLNEWLSNIGGHIGYCVLPQYRRRGYATHILQQSLQISRDLGIPRVLITCDDANVASRRTIEHCGGQLETVRAADEYNDKPYRRYWIG